jgi:hypothetical protein
MPDCIKVTRREEVTGTATGPSETYMAVYNLAIQRATVKANRKIGEWRNEDCLQTSRHKIKRNFTSSSRQLNVLRGEGNAYRETSTYTVVYEVTAEWECCAEQEVEVPNPPPTTPSTPTPQPQPQPVAPVVCCPEKIWVGYGWGIGGVFGWGRESGEIHFFCLSNPTQYVSFNFTGTRWGLGLGGGAYFIGAVAWDVEHASELPRLFYNWFRGVKFNLDIGIPVTRLLKLLFKGRSLVRVVRLLIRLARAKRRVNKIDPGTVSQLKSLVKPRLPNVKEKLVVFPLGTGLEASLHYLRVDNVIILPDFNSCGDPPQSIRSD